MWHMACHRLFITTIYYPLTHTSLPIYPHNLHTPSTFHPHNSHLCQLHNSYTCYPHNCHTCHPYMTYIRLPNVVNICATLFNITINISWNNKVQICWLEKWVELWIIDTYQSFLEGNVFLLITNKMNWIQIDPLCQCSSININIHSYINLHVYNNNLLCKFDWRV